MPMPTRKFTGLNPFEKAIVNTKEPTIVQFQDGKYAVRRMSKYDKHEFLDLKYIQNQYSDRAIWWPKHHSYFKGCVTDSISECEKCMRLAAKYEHEQEVKKYQAKDMGTTVKIGSIKEHSPEPLPKIAKKLKLPKLNLKKWFTD